jgi:hypothetical protein
LFYKGIIMPPLSRRPGLNQLPIPGQEPHPALVHILTPEFQNIDPEDFADIAPNVVKLMEPGLLRESLLGAGLEGDTAVRFKVGDTKEWIKIAVTPGEYVLLAREIPMLGRTAFTGTLVSRDKKMQAETGDPSVLARSDEDKAAANRAAFRAVVQKQTGMQKYLEETLRPRVRIIKKFTEMAQFSNLSRGSREKVKERFEELRTYVFGGMLDAIGNQRNWTEDQATLASRTLQKRLYLDTNSNRVRNFAEMLKLADEYYGYKNALVLDRLAEAAQYIRNRPDIAADVKARDEAKSE